MTKIKSVLLTTPEYKEQCFEYTEEQERLKSLLADLKVTAKLLKQDFYFVNDKEPRNIYEIRIVRYWHFEDLTTQTECKFKFGDSVANTQAGKETVDLYSILACVGSDWMFDEMRFEEFCDEYGYDTDSISAKKIYEKAIIQNKKLHRVFEDKDIEVLPR